VSARLEPEPGYKYSERELKSGLPKIAVVGSVDFQGDASEAVVREIRNRLVASGFEFYFTKGEIDVAFGSDIGFDDPRALERTTRPVVTDGGESAGVLRVRDKGDWR